MTWSMTLKVLPRAGTNSKLHQKKLQNVKFLRKTWVMGCTKKPFDDFRPKTQKFNFGH